MATDFSGETGVCLMENWEFSLLTSDPAWNKLGLARQRNVQDRLLPLGVVGVSPS